MAVGTGVVVVGLLLVLVGLVWLARARKSLHASVLEVRTTPIGDMAELLKQINILIDRVGVALGVSLTVMIFGVVLVGTGSAIIGVGAAI